MLPGQRPQMFYEHHAVHALSGTCLVLLGPVPGRLPPAAAYDLFIFCFS